MASNYLDPGLYSLVQNGNGSFSIVGASGGTTIGGEYSQYSFNSNAPVVYNGHTYIWNPDGTLTLIK